jgi:hypothetical protein
MSAPTPPPHPPAALDARTVWLGPRPIPPSDAGRRMILPGRFRRSWLIDVAARLGTAVTLAALLIVAGMILTAVDAGPRPTATTAGR